MRDKSKYVLSLKKNKADYILSITAMLQPVLVLVQLFMIDVLKMDTETANSYRIMLTAAPILVSMIIVLIRNFRLTVITYAIVGCIILLTLVLFPGRWPYMKDDLLKFTLPVVIPIGLCMASIRNFAVLMKCMLYVAIIAAFIGLLYAVLFLNGLVYLEGYSMPFSYALLFPTFILINKKQLIWTIFAVLVMIEMLAIGSRGAILISITYFLFVQFWGKMSVFRLLFYAIILILGIMLFFEPLVNFLSGVFDSVGISSRTLRLLEADELITHDSGRDKLSKAVWNLIDKSPIIGNGVWADRQYLDVYSHNVFLELLLDFGYLGTLVILIIFGIVQIGIFRKLTVAHKSMYIMMISLLIQLLFSSSYLISFNVGMFLGFSYLLSKLQKRHLYQDCRL
jgi:hypothetical protein